MIIAATIVALFLLLFDLAGAHISSTLIIAIPVLALLAFLGLVVTLVGAIGWASHFPQRNLAFYGVALTMVGITLFLISEKMPFGFDDPTIVFALFISGTPFLVGIALLLTVGVRRLKETWHRT
jgi:hypothetical protein